MTEMSPLRRRMVEDMTVRNLSPATQRSYIHAVAKFGRFFICSPERLPGPAASRVCRGRTALLRRAGGFAGARGVCHARHCPE